MQQILFLHGGESFSTYKAYLTFLKEQPLDYERLKYSPRWREWIATQLPYDDVLTPTMPNSYNANYAEWVIYFEKILPYLTHATTLVGHSLGAMFLAKYLHANVLPFTAKRVILVAGRYGMSDDNGSFNVTSATGVDRSADEVHLFHSEDDPVVPYSDMALFKRDLPSAVVHSFKDRLHFNEPTFPEILDILQAN